MTLKSLTRKVLVVAVAAIALSSTGTADAISEPPPDSGRYQHEAAKPTPLAFPGRGSSIQAEDQPITRAQVMARAKHWVDVGVPYDNNSNFEGYRKDCSGFVSMAWTLGSSSTTRYLSDHSYRIAKDDLLPGDALLWVNPNPAEMGHVRLFGGWLDNARERYWVYEQTPPRAVYREYNWSSTGGQYPPYRYNKIIEDVRGPASMSGDSRAELVYNQTDGRLTGWYNGNGFTTLPWTSDITVGTGFGDPARVKFADLSGDGRTELIYVNPDGVLRAWYNGNGFTTLPWTSEIVIGTGFSDPARVKFGDISGDGRAELIYVNPDGSLRAWYNGNGFTTLPWTSDIIIGTGFANPEAVYFADISGDRRAELVYNEADGRLRGWYNGNGFTTLPWTSDITIGTGFNDPTRVKFGDFSGDGRAELMYVNPDGALRSWYNGNGFTTLPWTSEINIGTGFSDPARVYTA